MQHTNQSQVLSSTKILKNSSVYTLGNILPQIANLFLLPVYTRYLSPSEYGIYVSMMMINSVLVIFYTLALERSLNRLYFDYNNEKERKELLGTVSIMLIISSTAFLLIALSMQSYSNVVFKSIPSKPYFILSFFIAYGSSFMQVPLTYFRIRHKAKKFIALSLSQFFLNAGLALYFLIVLNHKADGLLAAQMISYSLLMPVFLWVLLKKFSLTVKKKYALPVLAFSLPMVPSLLAAWIINLSDRIFIEHYLSVKEVGIYSLGYQIAQLTAILSGSIFSAYNPVFYELASDKRNNNKDLLEDYNHIILLTITLLAFSIALFSKEIISLFFSSEYIEAYRISIYIAAAYWISAGSGLLNLMIYQNKKTLQMMLFILLSALLNIVLNFIFIPQYRTAGAAMATIITFIFFFMMKYRYARKLYFIPIRFGRTIPAAAFAVGSIIGFEYAAIENIFFEIIMKGLVFLSFLCLIYATNKATLHKYLTLKTNPER